VGAAVGGFLAYFFRDDARLASEGLAADTGRDSHWLEPFAFGAVVFALVCLPRSVDAVVYTVIVGAVTGVVAAGLSHFTPDPWNRVAPLLAAVLRRFSIIKWTGVAVVAITGIVQCRSMDPAVVHSLPYLASFAVKMAGALGLFLVTLLLALPSPSLAGMRRHRHVWSGLNLMFAATIFVGAAMMHAAH
jgi:hypothetical protein